MSLTLVATGGTIASTRGADGVVTTTLTGEDLLASLPGGALDGPAGPVTVDVVDLTVPGSWNMSSVHAARVAVAASRAIGSGSRGVVVTHGTDVLEETSWLAELLCPRSADGAPIVFTAAMRHGSEFGGDGPRNLLDALRVAADPQARGRGVLVCFGGELHHARWVVKTHATGLHAFDSPGRAPVGSVDEDGVEFHLGSPSPPPQIDDAAALDVSAQVPVLMSHWDCHPELVDWHRDRGAAAFVVEGSGAGNVNGGLVDGLSRALSDGVPVVVATRCRRGEVAPIYGGAGGFATLAAAGAVGSGGLTAGKARLAVQVALAASPGARTADAVRGYFEGLEPSG